MTEDELLSEQLARYLVAAHAMQSGVAAEMGRAERASATEPKHLRVGINSAKVEQGGLADLLIKKGVITKLEYFTAMADAMEAEVKRYEDRLSTGGVPMKLA